MPYVAYETDTGEAVLRLQALFRGLTEAGLFTEKSTVPLADVEMWLTDSHYRTVGELLRSGFGTTATGEALRVLTQIDVLGAALKIELSQPPSDPSRANARYQALLGEWNGLLNTYVWGGGLEGVGLGRSQSSTSADMANMTGRSDSRKRTAYQNTDGVPARFPRGFGQRGDVPARSGTTTGYGGSGRNL